MAALFEAGWEENFCIADECGEWLLMQRQQKSSPLFKHRQQNKQLTGNGTAGEPLI
jgi:hypothetical protein